ncbi:MAG: SMC-Scp complex subunit ScpB [Steroidobacteraceae bacterium]
MNESHIRNVIEAALLAAGKPLQAAELVELFDEGARPQLQDIQAALTALMAEYSNRGIEIKETAAGFRIQVRREMANEISRLWPERPARYSRALLETLALIAYRQPITRAEIEAVRGVAVNPNILKTVIERNWVRVVGHRDVPGRPELLGTTRDFLDYFGLKNLDELPPLAELKVIGDIKVQFDLPDPGPPALAADPNGTTDAEAAAPAEGAPADAADATAAVDTAETVDAAAEVGAAETVDAAAEVGAAETVDAAAEVGAAETGDAAAEVGAAETGDAAAEVAAAEIVVAATEIVDTVDGETADGEQVASERRDRPAGAAPKQRDAGSGAEGSAPNDGAGEVTSAGAAQNDMTGVGSAADGLRGAASQGGHSSAEAGATGSADHASAPKAAEHAAGDPKKPTATRRGAPDSALYEAEEFAASIDADLAAGDDDGSEDDELSAAGPSSSELVAGPRDIDD